MTKEMTIDEALDAILALEMVYVESEDFTEESSIIIMNAINKIVDELEKQPKWIPCSERLPERDENVLTYHRNESFDYQYVSWIDDYSGKWAGFIGNLSDEVLAWMPLPEEYKDEEGSKE